MMLSAGALAMLRACAGTAAGATWIVDDSGGAGVDYMTIHAAVDAAGESDTIEVRSGTDARDCGCEQATHADRRGRGCGDGVGGIGRGSCL